MDNNKFLPGKNHPPGEEKFSLTTQHLCNKAWQIISILDKEKSNNPFYYILETNLHVFPILLCLLGILLK